MHAVIPYMWVLLSLYVSTALLIAADTACICAEIWQTSRYRLLSGTEAVHSACKEWALPNNICESDIDIWFWSRCFACQQQQYTGPLSQCTPRSAERTLCASWPLQRYALIVWCGWYPTLRCSRWYLLWYAKVSHCFLALSLWLHAGCAKNCTQPSSCIIGSYNDRWYHSDLKSVLPFVLLKLRVSYLLAGNRLAQADSCVHVYQSGYICDVPAPCFHIYVYIHYVS